MIVVRFTSGLGNQMFQYSFYQFLKNIYKDTEVKADLTWFYANNDHHGYELQRIFGRAHHSMFSVNEATKSEIFKVTGLIPNLFQPNNMITGNEKCFDKESVLWSFDPNDYARGKYSEKSAKTFEKFRRYPNRILRIFTGKKRKPYIIDMLSNTYEDDYYYLTHLDVNKDWYICGFFIEEKYIINRLDIMKNHLRFPDITDENNLILKNAIEETESVSIHVRRGDYLSVIYKNQFVTLDKNYYGNAIKYISEHVSNPHYFIFSDDAAFVKEMFKDIENKTIVAANSGDDSFRDMQLMSLCKHNIIANSTFSQWAALLNDNENHITVYPHMYLNGKDTEEKMMPGWVRM